MLTGGWRRDPARRGARLRSVAGLSVVGVVLAIHQLVLGADLLSPSGLRRSAPQAPEAVAALISGVLITVAAGTATWVHAKDAARYSAGAVLLARARGLSSTQNLAASFVDTIALYGPGLLLGLLLVLVQDPVLTATDAVVLMVPFVVCLLVLAGPGRRGASRTIEPTSSRVLVMSAATIGLVVLVVLLARGLTARRGASSGAGEVDALVGVAGLTAVLLIVLVAGGAAWVVGVRTRHQQAAFRDGASAVVSVVVLCVGASTVLATLSSSQDQARTDVAGLRVGADAVVETARPISAEEVSRGTAALRRAGWTVSPELTRSISVAGDSAVLLALPAEDAARLVRWREDLQPTDGADGAWSALVNARPEIPGPRLPVGTTGLELSAQTQEPTGPDALDGLQVEVVALLLRPDGVVVEVPFGGGPVISDEQEVAGEVVGRQALVADVEAAVVGDANLVALDVTVRSGVEGVGPAPERASEGDAGAAMPSRWTVTSLVAVAGQEAVMLPGSWQGWDDAGDGGFDVTNTPDGLPEFTFDSGFQSTTVRIGAGPSPTASDGLPAITAALPENVRPEFQGLGAGVTLDVVTTAAWLPRAGGRGAVVDLPTFSVTQLAAGRSVPTPRGWLLGDGDGVASEDGGPIEVLVNAGVLADPDSATLVRAPAPATWAERVPAKVVAVLLTVLVLALVAVGPLRGLSAGRHDGTPRVRRVFLVLSGAAVAGALAGLSAVSIVLPTVLPAAGEGVPVRLLVPWWVVVTAMAVTVVVLTTSVSGPRIRGRRDGVA